MKKIVIIALLFSLTVVSFTGCKEKTKNKKENATSSVSSIAPTTENNTYETVNEETVKNFEVMTSDEFVKELESILDLSKYDSLDSGIYMLIKDVNNYNFDKKISVNGFEIDVNKKLKDFLEAGFKLSSGEEDNTEIASKMSANISLEKGNNCINLKLINNSDKKLKIDECDIASFSIFPKESFGNALEDIKFSKNINEKSSWQDIIKTIGEPTNISYEVYDEGDGYNNVGLTYNNYKENYYFQISCVPSKGYIDYLYFSN